MIRASVDALSRHVRERIPACRRPGPLPLRSWRTAPARSGRVRRPDDPGVRRERRTHVLPLELGRAMPVIVRGEGVWVEDAAGRRYLDAMSGGSMAATLGHGRRDIAAAARAQAEHARVRPQRAAHQPGAGAARARAGRGGARGVQPRALHDQRGRRQRDGDPARPQLPRRARRAAALAGDLAGAGLPRPDDGDARADRPARAAAARSSRTSPRHLHIPPSTLALRPDRRGGPRGARPGARGGRSRERVGVLLRADQRRRAPRLHPAAAVLGGPRRAPRAARLPRVLRRGRDRRGPHRCAGSRATTTACVPDIIATAKGLGAGYAAIGAVLCREHVYDAVAAGSRRFPLGHTWDGAPLSCAVGLAVMDALRSERLVERVRERGPSLRDELAERPRRRPAGPRGARPRLPARRGVRRSARRRSFLPPELRVAGRIDDAAFEHGLITLSTQPTRDGYAGDQTLFAPAVHHDRRGARGDGLPVRRSGPRGRRRSVEPELSDARVDHRRYAMSSTTTATARCAR